MIISDVFQIYSPPPTQLTRMRSISSSSSSSSLNNKINFLDHLPSNIPNIDICTEWEHKQQYDPTYSSSIMQYKSTIERKYVYKNIMNNSHPLPPIQTEITPEMYAILIDWIVEIGTIDENTLCLAIHILDEYIQTTLIRRSCFQLVGCTCLLIAAKLEQIQAPSIDDFVTIACNCFDSDDMIRAEQKILQDLNYNIPRPTRSYFLDRFLLVSRVDCIDSESRRQHTISLSLPSPLDLRTHCDCLSPPSNLKIRKRKNRDDEEDDEEERDEERDDEEEGIETSSFNSVNYLHNQSTNLSWMSTPTKSTYLQRSNSLSSIYEESDLTSNESQSAQSPLNRKTIYSYTPTHGYVPSNERFKREESFAKMLLFITLQDYSFNQYRMSKIAAAIVHLTKQYHRPISCDNLWSPTMEYYTGYREEDLKGVIHHVNRAFHQIGVSKYKNILVKFDTKEYKYCSSTIFAIPGTKLRFDNIGKNEPIKTKTVDNCGSVSVSLNVNESNSNNKNSNNSNSSDNNNNNNNNNSNNREKKMKGESKETKQKNRNQITPQKLLSSERNE